MALAARCPACKTVFRLGTEQAAARGGMVRCGQCRNAFNALDALVRDQDLGVIDEVSAVTSPASLHPAEAVALPPSAPVSNAVDESAGTSPTFMRPDSAQTGQPPRRALGALTLLAAAALFAQAAYQWRDELAARWPPARSWLVAACVPLRCEVGYPAHIGSITIESTGIQTSGADLDVYVLSALLRNRDAVDLRYPNLELVLTDLQDRPILRRVLRPEDYLPVRPDADRSAPSGFAAGTELPIRILFELTDLRFSGYRLDRFYP